MKILKMRGVRMRKRKVFGEDRLVDNEKHWVREVELQEVVWEEEQ